MHPIEELVKQAAKDKSASFNPEVVIITIAVLAILTSRFKASRSEWSMIEKKAKKYLSQYIEKTETLIAQVKIQQ